MTPMGLKRIRRELGLTQEELADRLGVRRVTVARWEGGARRISLLAARLVQRIRAEVQAGPSRERGQPARARRRRGYRA